MLMNQTTVQINHENQFNEILTPQALEFLEKLHHYFEERRKNLLEIRQQIQEKLNEGKQLQFLSETKQVREGNWTIDQLPRDLRDRSPNVP